MPKGKKKVDHDIAAELQKRERLTVIETPAAPALCNHQNRHYTAGELLCVLEKGHKEDHLGYIDGKPTAWSDAAGTPIKKNA